MSNVDLLRKADALSSSDGIDKARPLYLQAIEARVPGAKRKFGEALIEFGKPNDYDEAESFLRDAVTEGDASASHSLADILVATERPDEAVEVMKHAFHEGEKEAALRIATILSDAVGDRKEAEIWYQVAIDRGDVRGRNDYGVFLSEDDLRIEEAKRVLLEAISSGDTLAIGNLGRVELDCGNYEDAVKLLKKGIAKGHANLLVPLAQAQIKLEQIETAKAVINEAIEKEIPGAHLVRANLLSEYGGEGSREGAESDYLAALEEEDEDANFYYALFLEDNHRDGEAIDFYKKAIEDGAETAYDNLAAIYERIGNQADMESYLRMAIDSGSLHAIRKYIKFLHTENRIGEIPDLIAKARSLKASPEEIREVEASLDPNNQTSP